MPAPFTVILADIANIIRLHEEIITTITNRIFVTKPMIKKLTLTKHMFFTFTTFSRTNSFGYNNSIS